MSNEGYHELCHELSDETKDIQRTVSLMEEKEHLAMTLEWIPPA